MFDAGSPGLLTVTGFMFLSMVGLCGLFLMPYLGLRDRSIRSLSIILKVLFALFNAYMLAYTVPAISRFAWTERYCLLLRHRCLVERRGCRITVIPRENLVSGGIGKRPSSPHFPTVRYRDATGKEWRHELFAHLAKRSGDEEKLVRAINGFYGLSLPPEDFTTWFHLGEMTPREQSECLVP
ncbi:MAG: hypothetical protein JXA20_13365 [Spirochaetes bacterium]|nr:hypothetical protein [Spirochaetota bacterium]